MKKYSLLITVVICLFVLNSSGQEPGNYTDLRDNKTYKTVTIGTQTWMAENLAYKADSGCWAYKYNTTYESVYGLLYNWEVAKNICPKRWHLPSKNEWQILINYLGGDTVAGAYLKSDTLWSVSDTGASKNNIFAALPGGCKTYIGHFMGVGENANWWTNTELHESIAWSVNLSAFDKGIVQFLDWYKSSGFSVRCIKDK